MRQTGRQPLSPTRHNDELKGFSRSIAELQWLLLILAMLYFFIPIRPITNTDALITTMVSYSVFVLVFRYLNFRARETSLRLAIETWAMIGFITTMIWHTGLVDSPLLNLYLLVIIACAITLGKIMTLLEVGLITCCYLYMSHLAYADEIFSPETFTMLMARFSPFLLVAYVTSMLAADILAAKSRITALSQTDDLTGLLNMRAFNLLFEKEIARVTRHAQPFSILMIDVDGLKAVNDSYGHLAGSRLLRNIAGTLRDTTRTADILARYGGDEFVVLLTNTDLGGVQIAAERLRTAVKNTSCDLEGNRIATTVSIGVASFPESVASANDVLDKADTALYKSKQGGKNRITCYQQEQDLAAVPACA